MNRIDDIRDVLGMRTIWAFILIGLFAAMQLTATFASYEDGQLLWVLLVEWCIYTAALVGVALLPGDPLPLRSKIFLVTAGPIATAIGYTQVQVPQTEALQGAFTTSVVAYLTVSYTHLTLPTSRLV